MTNVADNAPEFYRFTTATERRIVSALVGRALAMGWYISVYDGEEWTVKRTLNRIEVLHALASTECDTLRFRDDSGKALGTVLLIWGNDEDVISDCTDNADMAMLIRE